MHALSREVLAHLTTAPPEQARRLRAWFSSFPPDVQDILLDKARRRPSAALVFGEEIHSLGLVVG